MENGSLKRAVSIKNRDAVVEISPEGGAITTFQLRNTDINPLNFSFNQEQMPVNNRKGAPFRGHFACIGRWGPPSAGEIKYGVPDHGDFVSIAWTVATHNERSVIMEAVSELEGLHVRRHIYLHSSGAILDVSEEITNIRPLGRFINIVQHPTVAAPFLNPHSRVFCNATKGYHYASCQDHNKTESCWPAARYTDNAIHNISHCTGAKTGVHSFIVRPTDEFGWVCATSPQNSLLLGYVWRRSHYPWINHWCDYNDGAIRYRGLEFGTTGMHEPYDTMISSGNTHIFGEPVLAFIDAGETIEKNYTAFLTVTQGTVNDIEYVSYRNGNVLLSLDGEPFALASPDTAQDGQELVEK
jgi:hypothetical protein